MEVKNDGGAGSQWRGGSKTKSRRQLEGCWGAAAPGLKAQVSACCGSERASERVAAAAAAHRRKSSPSSGGVGKWFPPGDLINYFLIVGRDSGPTDDNNAGAGKHP